MKSSPADTLGPVAKLSESVFTAEKRCFAAFTICGADSSTLPQGMIFSAVIQPIAISHASSIPVSTIHRFHIDKNHEPSEIILQDRLDQAFRKGQGARGEPA